MSSVEIDDTDPRFDYKDNSWKAGGQSGEFDSTSHSTSTAGAMVKFGPFTGTSIRVFSTIGTSQPKIHFLVDGGDQNFVLPAQSGSSVQFQQLVYNATNLDPTAQHTLTINVLDPGPFTLDYVSIGGQSHTALQQTTSRTSSTTSSSPTTTIIPSVGGNITSSSESSGFSISASPTSSVDPSSPGASSSSTLLPAGAGANPASSAQASAQPTPAVSVSSASTLASATAMGAGSSSGPDAIVIGSVTGSIVFFAIIVVSVVLFLRRRRRRSDYRGRSVRSKKASEGHDPRPKQRPALHLSIPSSLSLPRSLQRPSLLPTHSSKCIPTSVKHPTPFGTSHAAPSFLAEDPNDSPVFDIKQRPVSGATMTTRVTVGTTIDQRISVPDSVYRYPYLETPAHVPVPPMPTLPTRGSRSSPTETATGSTFHLGFGPLGTNPPETLDSTVFSGYSESGIAPTGTGTSASRPLPHTPTDAKRCRHRETGDHAPQMQTYSHAHRCLPTTPSEIETVIHQDGGVRLTSNIQIQPRRELPPPYQDYGI